MGVICLTKTSDWSDWEKWSTRKVDHFFENFSSWIEPIHLVLPKLPEILVEWIERSASSHSQGNFTIIINPQREDTKK